MTFISADDGLDLMAELVAGPSDFEIARDAEWDRTLRYVRDELELDFEIVAPSTVEKLREQLVRQRLAASIERQAHEARAIVADVKVAADGHIDFVVGVPSGDLHELREATRMFLAAWFLAEKDARNAKNVVDADMRERLGRCVREAWVAWACEQPDPKPSWLLPWEALDESMREVDRQIGVAVISMWLRLR